MATRALHGIPRIDLASGLVLTVLGLLITLSPDNGEPGLWLDSLFIGAVTLPVIWRRRAPLACAGALAAGMVISGIPTFDQVRCGVAIPAALLIAYALGVQEPGRRSIAGLLLLLGGLVFLSFTDANISPSVLIFVAPLCAGVWAAGLVVASRTALAAELVARTRALELRREQTARLALELERTRLAAHLDAAASARVRAMIELSEQGAGALVNDPESARAAFAQIERDGRESLNELRDLLGVLRSDEAPERTPQPTLVQLGALLDRTRAAGRTVELRVDGERLPLPAGVELAAYRIVEHALEALEDADGSSVTVRLRYLPETLELEVGGRFAAGTDGQAALVAARERVITHGGSLTVQAPALGSTVLRARLPLAVAHA